MSSSTAEVAPGHFLQFYDDDDDLITIASAYLANGMARGEMAVVFATPDHTRAFQKAAGGGAIIAFDAADTLALFMADGRPVPEAFDKVVGTFVRSIQGNGMRACAYGEMVALLWQEGNVAGALELEDLWNSLLQDINFSLFCAYPASIIDAQQVADLTGVCALHTQIVGCGVPKSGAGAQGMAVTHKKYAWSKRSPTAARRFAVETLARWGCLDLTDHAALIVTELATNAIVHTEGGFDLTISSRDGVIRIAVADTSPALPARSEPRPDGIGGRGLHLIDAVADHWDVQSTSSGKLVWAEFVKENEVRA